MTPARTLATLAVATIASACGNGSAEPRARPSDEPESPAGMTPPPPPPPRFEHKLVMLANTPSELYLIDLAKPDPILLGTFWQRDGSPTRVTDIAVDRRGRMWAIGWESVYRVDPRTFELTELDHDPPAALNALAIASIGPNREVPDLLIAVDAITGGVVAVDPKNGKLVTVGDIGGTLVSSGDVTWSNAAGGLVLTAEDRTSGYEGLVSLDPKTYAATKIGDDRALGYNRVRGLTVLGDKLYGFTEYGQVIEIDAKTGVGTLVQSYPLQFWGAAIAWGDTLL